MAWWETCKALPTSFHKYWDIPEKLQTGGGGGGGGGGRLDMTKCIWHLINHKFSQFQALCGHAVYKKMKIILFLFRFDGNLSKK